MKTKILTLYHFTCEHGHNGISKTGVLRPNTHPFMPHRYIVQTKAAIHWFDIRRRARKDVVETLESCGQPEHWWVVRRHLVPSEFAYDAMWRQK